MSRYFKCDACGKLFNNENDKESIVTITTEDGRTGDVLKYDLCTKCYDRTIVFITSSLKTSTIDTSKCTYDKDGYLNKV